ncbi:MAG: DUF1223 domain-containing protein [Rickettsiales bacterium]
MFKKSMLSAAVMAFGGTGAQAADAAHPVVLELFTSQSCSSCPPADALLKELSASDPTLLPLSFHVDYWDYLSWKDVHSSPEYTARQRGYSRAMRANNVFTPQLIVGGTASMVGSSTREVRRAIEAAKTNPSPIGVTLSTGANGTLVANLTVDRASGLPAEAEIYQVEFNRYSKTQVAAGENGGRTLESVNNVSRIRSLGAWKTAEGKRSIALQPTTSEGVAILVQTPGLGPLLGAGVRL